MWGWLTPPAGRPACGATYQPPPHYVGSPHPPRLHLHRSLSWFDPRAHDGCFGLYIAAPTPLPRGIPETLIHISHSYEHTPGGLGLELSNIVD